MKVFTNGCFDILHRGHLELLEYCSELASLVDAAHDRRVIVGLNSDESIRRLKGRGRPINNQDDRKFFLESLKFVDEVKLFDEDTPYELIKSTRPDIIVKGGDYKPDEVVGNYLCEVKIFDFVDGYSTTNIVNKL
jgi:rfaE bifunctional protein nucleotidyltransferase chain/domain